MNRASRVNSKRKPVERRIGLISDTHGLVRPEAMDALAGVELIIHAGDIGGPAVLRALRRMAPVVAVRGNNDKEPWATRLPETRTVTVGKVSIYIIHDRKDLRFPPAGFQVVVTGHSHRPVVERHDGVLYVNPGSAGPRRFNLPVSVGLMKIDGTRVSAELMNLQIKPA